MSGNWTPTPQNISTATNMAMITQNISVSSSNSTIIYYTMVNTYDGSTPTDPREPSSSDNDGSIIGTFQLYAIDGQNKQSKLRFRGYNNGVAGPSSIAYYYSIDASTLPWWIAISGSANQSWTTSPQNVYVSCNKADIIYYTMVNTYDGSDPVEPPVPTVEHNNGSISGSSGVFQIYASSGQYKRMRVRFRGYNSVGYGGATGSVQYSIDLR